MRHNILLLAVLIFSMKIFSFDEGFADNNSINIAYIETMGQKMLSQFYW